MKCFFESLMKCLLPVDSCVRLRGKDGNYISLLACSTDESGSDVVCVDLVHPDGTVLYCGVPIELVNVIVEHLGLEAI